MKSLKAKRNEDLINFENLLNVAQHDMLLSTFKVTLDRLSVVGYQ